MRQLSSEAAGHLYADTATANGNVSLIQIHDQNTAPGGVVRFKQILTHLQARLHSAPLFRQRLQRVPLALDDPYWVDDARFDLEYHVRHIALPRPGDWRQFCIQVSRIHARPFDLDRPLWEAYVIEGLDGLLDLPPGGFALMFKTHLAAVDLGELGRLTSLLCDAAAPPLTSADAAAVNPANSANTATATTTASPPPPPWFAETAPGHWALARLGLWRVARSPGRAARPLARLANRLAPAAVALAGELLLRPEQLPPTRFNAVVSPHRVFETRRFSEADLQRIAALVPGATVDDVVLSVVGGALRQYLQDEGELPDAQSLRAAVLTDAGHAGSADASPAHAAGSLAISPAGPLGPFGPFGPLGPLALGTDLADPLARLAFVQGQAEAARALRERLLQAQAASPLARSAANAGRSAPRAETVPAAERLKAWSRGWVGRAGLHLGARTATANCSMAWLPTLPPPLTLCGARLTYHSAMLPITDGLGLALAVSRCDGLVAISPTACRELVPEPAQLAQCLRDSFQASLACAEAAAAPASRPARPARATATAAAALPAATPAAAPSVPAKAITPAARRGSAGGTARRQRPPG